MPIEIEVHTVPHFKAPVNGKKKGSKSWSVLALLGGKIALSIWAI